MFIFRQIPAPLWDTVLDLIGIDDIYLKRGYFEASAIIDGGAPVMLHGQGSSGDVVLCLLVRPIPDTKYFDATTPYGYGGPVSVGQDPPLDEFRTSLQSWCKNANIVSTFFRSHPAHPDLVRSISEIAYERELAGTVTWNISAGDLITEMRQTHRSMIRKAMREGIRAEVTWGSEALDIFEPMYRMTMTRLDAAQSYHFEAPYWAALRNFLSDNLVIATAWQGDLSLASSLCLRSGQWLHYHLSATSDAGRRGGASRLVLYAVAEAARATGTRYFHLGGGYGGRDDSLLGFKRGFAPKSPLTPARVSGVIHDPESYQHLSGELGSRLDFFPAYRTPVELGDTQ